MTENKLTTGRNTWNVRSVVLWYVLMPEAFAVSLGLKVYNRG